MTSKLMERKMDEKQLQTERCPACGGTCDLWLDWGPNKALLGKMDFSYVPYKAYLVCAHHRCRMNKNPATGKTDAQLDLGIQAALREVEYELPKGEFISRFWPTGGLRIKGPRPTGSAAA